MSVKLAKDLDHLDKISRELQEIGMSLRMVPVRPVFQKMARLVRDLAKKTGRKVEFVMSGEDTELDKNVVDKIGDPLVHMVRNAVDHGLETSAEERLAAGKDAVGRIELRAFHKGGNICIEIEDDGRGLPRDKILAKAIERGLVREGETLSDREIHNLIFEPGFSTAKQVTDISGRGVGMDVVRRNIEELRGTCEIMSEPGKGSRFQIKLPLTLAIIEGMVISCGGEHYIVPTLSVVRLVRPAEEDLSHVFDRGEMLAYEDQHLPLFRLGRLFDVPAETDPQKAVVVVVEDEGKKIGLLADDLLGQQSIVIKSLGEAMQDTDGVAGGAIMSNGNVALILDVAGLIRVAHAAMTTQITINILQIILLLYLPLPKGKKVPTYKENRIINIILAKGHLLALTDAKSMFANTMMGFKECFKFDLSKSQAALNAISGGAALFSFTGMSFSVGKKSLDYAQKYLSVNDGQVSPYYFKMFETIHNYLSGTWDCALGEEYIEYDIKIGETFCAATHLLYIGYIYMERGDFDKTWEIIERLKIISEEFNTDHASVMYYTLISLLLNKQGKMREAIELIDHGLATAKNIGLSNRCFSFLGMLLQIKVNIGQFNKINKTFNAIKKHIEQEKRIVPYYYSNYITGLLLYNICYLEYAFYVQNNEQISKYKHLASKSSSKAIKNSQKVFSDKPQIFCLVGRYYWIINKQKKALKWWKKSIQVGKELGARPDLSRTYFEVGKRLLEPQSIYTSLNGIDAKDYLGKAKDLFEQMNLQQDLKRLDNVLENIALQTRFETFKKFSSGMSSGYTWGDKSSGYESTSCKSKQSELVVAGQHSGVCLLIGLNMS